MTLDPIQLDDLTWQELTTAARERMVPASRGQWTLHAPVDPGVTLVELFAAQFEQRLFWMDQSSRATMPGLLRLLGISLSPARSARGVMCLRSDRDVALGQGTDLELACDPSASSLLFATERAVRALPLYERPDGNDPFSSFRPLVSLNLQFGAV